MNLGSFFHGYLGYTPFSDDSSHHEAGASPGSSNPSPLLRFLGVARREAPPSDIILLLASCTDSSAQSVDTDGIKKALQNVSRNNYYTLTCGDLSWHVAVDDLGLIYLMICTKSYPQRCAYMCLEELQPEFRSKAGKKCLTAKENGLDSTCKSCLEHMWEKFENVESIDSVAKTMKKVEGAKLVMQENIELSLKNVVKMEEIQDSVEDLSKKADVFKKQGGQLKNRMYWRYVKTRIIVGIIALILLGVIAGIISYCVIKYKRHNNDRN